MSKCILATVLDVLMVSENKSLLTAKIFVEDQFGTLLRVFPKYIKCFALSTGGYLRATVAIWIHQKTKSKL